MHKLVETSGQVLGDEGGGMERVSDVFNGVGGYSQSVGNDWGEVSKAKTAEAGVRLLGRGQRAPSPPAVGGLRSAVNSCPSWVWVSYILSAVGLYAFSCYRPTIR